MRMRARVAIRLTVVFGVIGGASQAWAASMWVIQQSQSPSSTYSSFYGVVTTSPSNAWAVGAFKNHSGLYRTLIEHYDGTAWAEQKSPNVKSENNFLYAVNATSASNAWAVGTYWASGSPHSEARIEHFDGTRWTIQTAQNPDPNENTLIGVTATSTTSAWAVGHRGCCSCEIGNGPASAAMAVAGRGPRAPSTPSLTTLIEHFDGNSWQVQPSVDPGLAENCLNGVDAASASEAWAAGYYRDDPDKGEQSLVEHYDGSRWVQQATPNPGTREVLYAVSAASPTDVWAVGDYVSGFEKTLIVHYDGTSWTQVPSPNGPSSANVLYDVKAISPTEAWAVGAFIKHNVWRTLILHYDGTSWAREQSKNVGTLYANILWAVDATSSANAFTAGDHWINVSGTNAKTLVEHCC